MNKQSPTKPQIHVFTGCGGVGKTTTTVNLSTALALNDNKVLVIDLDPQGNCSSSFGIEKDSLSYHAYHLLLGEAQLDQVSRETEIKNLMIVPTNTDLAGAEIELVSEFVTIQVSPAFIVPDKFISSEIPSEPLEYRSIL